jgi:hypothetical protein
MRLLIMLDRIVKNKDFDALKDFVKNFSIEPVLEYGLPVGGEGVKELYEISERYHLHKQKIGAEWWVRDEIEDIIQQLKGYSGESKFLDMVALIWKEVDMEIESEPRIKESAFRKALNISIIKAINKAGDKSEAVIMDKINGVVEKSGFLESLHYDDDFVE